MEKRKWTEDLYIYRDGILAPPAKENFQEYIDLYFAEKDDKYFSWFLYYYEPELNTKAMELVQEYAMQGHFVDIKQAYVFGMMKALQKYDITLGVPFLVYKGSYVKNEVDEYIRTMRHGYTMQSADEQKTARKAMALYGKLGYKSDDDTIRKIAAVVGKSEKDTREIIQCAVDNTHFVDFCRQYADEDGETTGEDVICDHSTEPGRAYLHQWREEALFGAYEKLNYREREMIADHLGFCPNCCGVFEMTEDKNGKPVKAFRKEKAYIDLAAEHTLSSPDTAYRICHGGYDKMLIELAIDEYIHIVELRLKEKTKTSVTYEYCADHSSDWGEIRYSFDDDDYDVTRYVYADKKGGFFFASAGEWIIRQAEYEKFPKHKLIVTEKF